MSIYVSSLILAGGKSSRMCQDKALLRIKGKTLLTQIYEVAQECTEEVYLITPFQQKYASFLPDDCLFIPESQPFQGPLIALTKALNYLNSEWVLVLACDLPLLTATEVKIWLQYLPTLSAKTVAFLPRHAKGWECLCGFYRLSYLAELPKLTAQGYTSLQKWLKKSNC